VKVIIEIEILNLGSVLSKARKKLAITQTRAAADSQMSQANLNRIETEEAKGVPFTTLIKIGSAINLRPLLKDLVLQKVSELIKRC
jgi:DNA-binding Xre family transcriptional regulator